MIVGTYSFHLVNWNLQDAEISGTVWEGEKPISGARVELIQSFVNPEGYENPEVLDSAFTNDSGGFVFRDVLDLDMVRSDMKTALGNKLKYYCRAGGKTSTPMTGDSLLVNAGVEPPEPMTWEQHLSNATPAPEPAIDKETEDVAIGELDEYDKRQASHAEPMTNNPAPPVIKTGVSTTPKSYEIDGGSGKDDSAFNDLPPVGPTKPYVGQRAGGTTLPVIAIVALVLIIGFFAMR